MLGKIYQKPSGRYRVYYPWKPRDIWIDTYLDGTPLYHWKQANRVLEKLRAEDDEGKLDPSSWGKDKTLLFENAWVIYQDQNKVSQAREDQREMVFQKYFLPYWKRKSLKDIEEPHIHEWLSKCVPGTLKSSYRHMILVTLKAFLNSYSICRRKAMKFPVISIPKQAIPWLTKEQQKKVLEFVLPQHRPIIWFCMIYGCRTSEACNLRKSDIDWQKRVITLRGRKNNIDNELPIVPEIEKWLVGGGLIDGQDRGHGETRGRSMVSVGTLNYATPYLGSLLKGQHPPINLFYIFSTLLGQKYRRQTVYQEWIRASRLSNKRYGTPIMAFKNATRHSKAHQLINDDVSIETVARVLGNSPRVVERAYGKITVKKVGEILASSLHRSK